MRFDKFLDPVSDDQPCGPDLDLEGDTAYFGFISEGIAALPKPFYDVRTGAPFDRASIDITTFQKTSATLLERSRDIRLLVLEARLQASAGKLVAFCECVLAIDQLLERFWSDVHPGADGDMGMRSSELANFNHRPSVVIPLDYATIIVDRRLGPISLRSHVLGSGGDTPRTGEVPGDAAAIEKALASEGNDAVVKETTDLLVSTRAAFNSIAQRFAANAPDEPEPDFDLVGGAIDRILALLQKARPGAAPPPVPSHVDLEMAGTDGGSATGQAPAIAALRGQGTHSIPNHADARAALQAAELFLLTSEPSSPALILIHQSRLLIGKTLADALDALMPSRAEYARIKFGPGDAFELRMSKIRDLAASSVEAAGNLTGSEPGTYAAADRVQAYDLVASVEVYLRRSEPTSPIPFLLQRAQQLANREFSAIIGDIFEKE